MVDGPGASSNCGYLVPKLARRLGSTDIFLITMGAIIGSGIFRVPSLVAERAHSNLLTIVSVWIVGGLIACLGAAVFAQLASNSEGDGGVYDYLRQSFHPIVGFVFGWQVLVLGAGSAAAALIFADYFERLTGLHFSQSIVAVVAIILLMIINFAGTRQGATLQNGIMLLKILAIGVVIACGFLVHEVPTPGHVDAVMPGGGLAFGAALVAVLFAYSGFQNATLISGEVHNSKRAMPIGLFLGVVAVTIVYVAVTLASLHALGPVALAHSKAPLADVVRLAIGTWAERFVAVAVALSTLGFLSNAMLNKPRLYHAMARQRQFPAFISWVHPQTRAPIPAILLQGTAIIALVLTGTFQTLVTYSVISTFLFYSIVGIAATILQYRRTPRWTQGGIFMSGFFALVCAGVVCVSFVSDPVQTSIGFAIILTGVPAYFLIARLFNLTATIPVERENQKLGSI